MTERVDAIHDYFSSATSRHPIRVIVLLVCVVLGLSFFVFSRQSLRLDEAQSLWQTSHTPAKMLSIIAEDVHVPLYHMILHFWQVAFGNEVASARGLSLLFFALSIPAVYLVGKTAYGNSVGIFAPTLLAISPFMNWYGNEIRMYSLFTFATIVNQYFFLRIIRERGSMEANRAWWGYTGSAIAGIFTHYFFGFALLAQLLFFMLYKKEFEPGAIKKFIRTGIILFASFLPWIVYVWSMGAASNTRPMISEPTTINVFNTFSQFLFGFQNDHLNTMLVSLWPLSVLLVFLSLRAGKRTSLESIYLLMALLVPITAVFAISTAVRPIFLTRYLILTLPSLYLLVSWLFWTYPPRLSFVAKTVVIAIIISTLATEVVSPTTPVKENYREASLYLTERVSAEDIVVVSAPFTIYPVEYYYKGAAAIETLPRWDRYTRGSVPGFVDSELPNEVKTIKGSHEKLWLLLSYDQGYEQKLQRYFDTNYERLEAKTFSPGLSLYSYKLRYDTDLSEPIVQSSN